MRWRLLWLLLPLAPQFAAAAGEARATVPSCSHKVLFSQSLDFAILPPATETLAPERISIPRAVAPHHRVVGENSKPVKHS